MSRRLAARLAVGLLYLALYAVVGALVAMAIWALVTGHDFR